MQKIVLDAAALAEFAGLTGSAEVCDEAGRVLGVFVTAPPPAAPDPPRAAGGPDQGGFTDEEIEAAFAAFDPNDPGITTEELRRRAWQQ